MADRVQPRPSINKNHGFFKFVVRNQIDRDNFEKEVQSKSTDKEVKARTVEREEAGAYNCIALKKPRSKLAKKPIAAVYVPPHRRDTCQTGPELERGDITLQINDVLIREAESINTEMISDTKVKQRVKKSGRARRPDIVIYVPPCRRHHGEEPTAQEPTTGDVASTHSQHEEDVSQICDQLRSVHVNN